MSHNPSDSSRHVFRNYLLLLIPLGLIPIAAGWVGDIVKDWVTSGPPGAANRNLLILGVATLFAAGFWLVRNGRRLLPARVLEQSSSGDARRVVIALLSPCENLRRDADGHWEVLNAREALWVPLKGKALDQLVGKSSGVPQWTWQQTLRAAWCHRTALERLVLVGSTGPKGSGRQDQLDLARAFLDTWFPGTVMIYGTPATPGSDYDGHWQADFENLEGLGRLLRNILRELSRDPAGYTDRDIIIDCTGGFKVASIAAALVTLDRPELMFQYVGNTGEVTGFNVSAEQYGG